MTQPVNWQAVGVVIAAVVMLLTLSGFLVGRWTSAAGRVRRSTLNEAAIGRLTELATSNEARWTEHLKWGEGRADEVRRMERTVAINSEQIGHIGKSLDRLTGLVEQIASRTADMRESLARHVGDDEKDRA